MWDISRATEQKKHQEGLSMLFNTRMCVVLYRVFCILVFGLFLTWVTWWNTAIGCGNVSAVHRVIWAWVLFCSVPVVLLVIRFWRQRTIIDGKGLKSPQKESRSLYLGTSTLLVSFPLGKYFVFLYVGPLCSLKWRQATSDSFMQYTGSYCVCVVY